MSVNLQVYGKISGRIDNELVALGSLEIPVSLSVAGEVYKRVDQIATGANALVYNNELGSFDFLYLASDRTVRILITDNAANSLSLTLYGTNTASKFGVPLMLGSHLTSGASAKINSLRAYNSSGNTAHVACLAIT